MSLNSGVTAHTLESDNNYYQISDDDDDLNDDSLLEEPAESANSNSVGFNVRGPYERAWTTEATRALIHIRGPMQGMFNEGRQKRTALWLHCTRQLQKMGFRYSAAKVQKKWHNIIITYTKNLPKKKSSGYVHWEFFEDMHKYLKDKKFETYDNPVQSAHYYKSVMEQHQQEQHQEKHQRQELEQSHIEQQIQSQLQQQLQLPPKPLNPPQQPSTAPLPLPLPNNKAPPTVLNDIMTQFGNGNQLELLAHTADANMNDKSNDEFDEDSTNMSELKQPKIEFHDDELPLEITHAVGYETEANKRQNGDFMPPGLVDAAPDDGIWWKDYFERKLEVEREKIQCQKELHREQMQFQKMSLVQQEKIERLKIDAINSLTATLQKLVEAKNRKT